MYVKCSLLPKAPSVPFERRATVIITVGPPPEEAGASGIITRDPALTWPHRRERSRGGSGRQC